MAQIQQRSRILREEAQSLIDQAAIKFAEAAQVPVEGEPTAGLIGPDGPPGAPNYGLVTTVAWYKDTIPVLVIQNGVVVPPEKVAPSDLPKVAPDTTTTSYGSHPGMAWMLVDSKWIDYLGSEVDWELQTTFTSVWSYAASVPSGGLY